jgi:hypothetical protein
MLVKTIREKYLKVVSYLQEKYVFDINSTIPRSEIYDSFKRVQIRYNLPDVLCSNMGFIVRHFLEMQAFEHSIKMKMGKEKTVIFSSEVKIFIFFNYSFTKTYDISSRRH